MKDKFNKSGITLIELLVVVGLMGLIFALGIHPMTSQLKLIEAQRAEITLFDDANLAVAYISRDAMSAEEINNADVADGDTSSPADGSVIEGTVSSWVEFTTSRSPLTVVKYERNGSDLRRLINNNPDRTITNRLSADPSFRIITSTTLDRLITNLNFVDPKNPTITAQRNFEVMLRCRDNRR